VGVSMDGVKTRLTIERVYDLARRTWPDLPVCVRGDQAGVKRVGFLWPGGRFQEVGSGPTWEVAWGAAYGAYRAGSVRPLGRGVSATGGASRRGPGAPGGEVG